MQVYNDELYHYGKIGMKWGRRNKSGATTKSGSRNNNIPKNRLSMKKITDKVGKLIKEIDDTKLSDSDMQFVRSTQYRAGVKRGDTKMASKALVNAFLGQ